MGDINISFKELAAANVKANDPDKGRIGFQVDSVTGDYIIVEYNTFIGNYPARFGNEICVWKGDGVRWGDTPLFSKAVPSDDQYGQVVIDGLTIGKGSFTVGYSVGNSPEQTAACVVIDGSKQTSQFSCAINITSVNDGMVEFEYKTLQGYTPSKHGAWVGIWDNDSVPYPAAGAKATTNISSDSANGNGVLLVNLASGHQYTVGLFLPEKGNCNPTCLAATALFKY